VGRSIELSAAELEILLRICTRYRSSLPLYLRSAEEEARLIDEVIQKLSLSSR
jgi:hypothetical protein